MKKINKLNKLNKLLVIVLLCIMILPFFASCSESGSNVQAEQLSFKSALSYDELFKLNGKKVSINGYLATSSPVDGSFIFLMNLPYQSCPFCKPNTTELSNTMEVYPKKGEKFSYTDRAVKVVGTLDVASDPEKGFTDIYGYKFNFRILDASYSILSADELNADILLWQKISDSGVVSSIANEMYGYVNFVCTWNDYFVNKYTLEDGSEGGGYYLYAQDAINYLTKDGAQYNYGYKEGYFDSIIKKIQAVDPDAFSDLISNVRAAQALAESAVSELMSGNYTYEEKYLEKFDRTDYYFTLNKGEELKNELDELYSDFSNWLASWEL